MGAQRKEIKGLPYAHTRGIEGWVESYYIKEPMTAQCPTCFNETVLITREQIASLLANVLGCGACGIRLEKASKNPDYMRYKDIVKTKWMKC